MMMTTRRMGGELEMVLQGDPELVSCRRHRNVQLRVETGERSLHNKGQHREGWERQRRGSSKTHTPATASPARERWRRDEERDSSPTSGTPALNLAQQKGVPKTPGSDNQQECAQENF